MWFEGVVLFVGVGDDEAGSFLRAKDSADIVYIFIYIDR